MSKNYYENFLREEENELLNLQRAIKAINRPKKVLNEKAPEEKKPYVPKQKHVRNKKERF